VAGVEGVVAIFVIGLFLCIGGVLVVCILFPIMIAFTLLRWLLRWANF
jgi:hypothetical protein